MTLSSVQCSIEEKTMLRNAISTKMKRIHQRLNGSRIEFNLTPYQNTLDDIDTQKTNLSKMTDDRLKELSQELIKRTRNDGDLDDLLVEAFALVREAVRRVLKIHPYDVQLMGGIAMHQGKLIEMQTGEGKTLSAVFSAYLNALSGKGVHVLTFNDYLARRDALWMGPIYEFLCLSVGFVQEGMPIEERKEAYDADITYLTAKESGFDFLRDSLCNQPSHIVHRAFHYAIIDEIDSILIDEARVPLIIAGTSDDHISHTHQMAHIARQLAENRDFEYDEYVRSIHLTEDGFKRVECLLGCTHLHKEENFETLARLNCALHAEYLLHRDVDYIVRNSKVELVDEFTGRVADKRRWPDGLQAAIEAKEHLSIQSRGNILNSITLQHFIQLYPKLSGMTATAQPAEEEFRIFYHLPIVVIPAHKPCIRIDHPDRIYPTRKEKNEALVDEITRVYPTRRPILVGTRSVKESAGLAQALREQGIPCQVLNAKRDAFEAQIVAQAGKLGAITISTNMAGRGTDIRLGGADEAEKGAVKALGGLYIIGTNRHESRRIDHQLRGRAGWQGDPGSSRFFISLEDDLFVKYRLEDLLSFQYRCEPGDGPLEHPIVVREIDRIQRIIEGQNLEIKKTLCRYSSLIEKQRKMVFLGRIVLLHGDFDPDFYRSHAPEQFHQLQTRLGEEKLAGICRRLSMVYSDRSWSRYLAEMADIREGIHLNRIGGKDPVLEFHKLAIEIFDRSKHEMDQDVINTFQKIRLKNHGVDWEDLGLKAPSSTWTYLIHDNPFEDQLAIKLVGSTVFSIGAGILGPLMVLYLLLKKVGQKKK